MWWSITGVLALGPLETWMSYNCRARSILVVPIARAPPFEHPARYGNPRLPHSPVQFPVLFEQQKWLEN